MAVVALPAAAVDNPSGLPLPRYVSLKSSRINVRKGPGSDYPIAWIYQRSGLPVEVIKEFELWRQIRDSEGATGWILHSLLSGRRTALLAPWDAQPAAATGAGRDVVADIAVHGDASVQSAVLAIAEPGTLAEVGSCDTQWCRVVVGGEDGYVQQKSLWGVYPDETIK